MIEMFSLDSVSSSAAVFNAEKLDWLNHKWINEKPVSDIAELFVWYLKEAGLVTGEPDMGWLEKVVAAQREKAKTMVEMVELSRYFLADKVEFDEKAKNKFLTAETKPVVERLIEMMEPLDTFSEDTLKPVFEKVMEETGLKMGKVAQPVRVALTGGTISPGIFDTIEIFGKEKTLERLKAAVAVIG
jgi:glutamyl-tRNA synthetase